MTSPAQHTILIVDDQPDYVQLMSVRLRAAGYDIQVAYNGADALNKAKIHHPSLIVLDVMMPQLNGFQVCRQLKKDPMLSEIPVLFLTAKTQPSDRFWGMEVGASDYLTKPVDPRLLLQKVQHILSDMK